jgi:hypothetical protein
VTEHVLGPYWGGCIASALSLYLIWSIMDFFLVCVKNWTKFCSECLKEQGLLVRTRNSWEYDINMDLLRCRVERCDWLDLFCSEQLLIWGLHESCNVCRKFLDLWSFPRQPAVWVSVTDLKVLILAVCRCLWLLYGEVCKHIRMENVHSETTVSHFIAIFGFCMIWSATKTFREFEYTVQTISTTNLRH